MSKMYTIPEAAKILGICKETLRKWLKIYEMKISTDEFGYKSLT